MLRTFIEFFVILGYADVAFTFNKLPESTKAPFEGVSVESRSRPAPVPPGQAVEKIYTIRWQRTFTVLASQGGNPLPEALTDQWVYLLSDASESIHGKALSAQG